MAKLDRRTVNALPGPEGGRFDVIHWDDDMPGRVLRSGARSWIVRYRAPAQRLARQGVGAVAGKAREGAAKILAKAKLGQDARAEINERRSAASAPKERTLGDAIELYARHVVAGQKARTQVARPGATWRSTGRRCTGRHAPRTGAPTRCR